MGFYVNIYVYGTYLLHGAGVTTAFWVSVASNTSGSYTVSLALSTGSGPTAIIGEVDVTVLGFQIPERSSFMADTGVEFAPFFQWAATPAAARAALVKGVYAQLAEYRINRLVACDGVTALGAPTAHIIDDDGSSDTAAVQLDTEAMDDMIEFVCDMLRRPLYIIMQCLRAGFVSKCLCISYICIHWSRYCRWASKRSRCPR